jgi:hypothetical protein
VVIRICQRRPSWSSSLPGKIYIQVERYTRSSHTRSVNYPQKDDGTFNWAKIVDTIVNFSKDEKQSKDYDLAVQKNLQHRKDFAKELGLEYDWQLKGYPNHYTLDISLSEDELRHLITYLKENRKPEWLSFLAKK